MAGEEPEYPHEYCPDIGRELSIGDTKYTNHKAGPCMYIPWVHPGLLGYPGVSVPWGAGVAAPKAARESMTARVGSCILSEGVEGLCCCLDE